MNDEEIVKKALSAFIGKENEPVLLNHLIENGRDTERVMAVLNKEGIIKPIGSTAILTPHGKHRLAELIED